MIACKTGSVHTVRSLPNDSRGTTMKILLAVDGSTYTKRALGYLTAHDEMCETAA